MVSLMAHPLIKRLNLLLWYLGYGVPGEKPLGGRTRTNNKLNPHMTPSTGIEPGPHWWEASALTTAPSLLPSSLVLFYGDQ